MCKKLIYVMAFVLALGSTAHAALYLWNGSAGDGNWDTPANWTVTDSLWTWPNEETGGSHINSDTIGIDILNGDAVSRDGALRIKGADASTTPVLTLNNGSSLTLTDRLATIGDPNIPGLRGQIDILGGSTLTITGSAALKIADDDNTWGMLNIVDSTVDIADNLDIDQGEGTINISGDSVVNWGDDMKIADGPMGKGYLNVSGNAVLNGGDDLITDTGEGHITITDNAIVNVDDFVIVDDDYGVGSLEISGNATINSDDFKIVDDPGGIGSMVISGNATINCDDYYGNQDSGDPSSSTVTLNGGTVNVGDDTTFNNDNPGTATITINSGSWLSGDDITVSDNLDGTAHVTINGGQMICNDLKLGDSGGDDIGQIRIFLNGGTLQANTLSINITDTQIIYTGGLLRIASANVNEADMQQLITDGTIVADGAYSIVTDGDYSVLNSLSPTQAKLPNPADGTEGVLLGSSLSWVPGNTAATHDVYFGASSPPAFIGNQEAATYYQPIEVGTTYYWQIDEVEADGTTKHTGAVWSFTTTTDLSTVSEIATQPNPADGAVAVELDATLSWWPGASAVSHDVYFGTTSPPALLGNTTEFSLSPGPLELDTTYYWRVDAVAADGTVHTGDIWSFTTKPDVATLLTDPRFLVGWWKLDEGQGTTAIDSSGHGNDGTVNGATWVINGQEGGALEFDGVDDYVDCGNPSILDFGTGDWTVSAWINATEAATLVPDDSTIVGKGGDHSSAALPGVRYQLILDSSDYIHPVVDDDFAKYDPEGNIPVIDGAWHHIVMMRRDGTEFRVYVDGVEDMGVTDHSESTIPDTYDLSGTSKFNAYIGAITNAEQSTPGTVVLEKLFVGMIDDVRIYNVALGVDAIELLAVRLKAWGPSPADGATEVERSPTLSWFSGSTAASHDVYFGDSSPPAFIGNQTETSYSPAKLDKGKTYYWRIDEVEADGTTKYEGAVWSFTVTSAGR